MSFHGVQIESPIEKLCAMLNVVFQMTYHKKVSRKKRQRSMMNMSVSVNAAWLRQSAVPKYLSEQSWTFMPTMTWIGLWKARVKKKYDSTNLQLKMVIQRPKDVRRWEGVRGGWEGVKF